MTAYDVRIWDWISDVVSSDLSRHCSCWARWRRGLEALRPPRGRCASRSGACSPWRSRPPWVRCSTLLLDGLSDMANSRARVPSMVFHIQPQPVSGGECRQQVLQDTHGILLWREHEVSQGHGAAQQAHVPEQTRNHRLPVFPGSHGLYQPPGTEHGSTGKADQFPWRHLYAGQFKPVDREGRKSGREGKRVKDRVECGG